MPENYAIDQLLHHHRVFCKMKSDVDLLTASLLRAIKREVPSKLSVEKSTKVASTITAAAEATIETKYALMKAYTDLTGQEPTFIDPRSDLGPAMVRRPHKVA